jgi:hypothetical protein
MKDITGGEFVGDFRNDYTTNWDTFDEETSLRSVHRAQPRPCRPDGILTFLWSRAMERFDPSQINALLARAMDRFDPSQFFEYTRVRDNFFY